LDYETRLPVYFQNSIQSFRLFCLNKIFFFQIWISQAFSLNCMQRDINWIALSISCLFRKIISRILLPNITQIRFIIVHLDLRSSLILLVSVELVWHNQPAKLTDLFKLIIRIVYMQINSANNVPFSSWSLEVATAALKTVWRNL